MSEAKYTELPWKINDNPDDDVAINIAREDGDIIANVWRHTFDGKELSCQDIAEFIVRSVNNHDALLQALRDAEDALKGMVYDFEHNTGENVDADINHTMETIEQALAKAKGES